MSHFNRRNRHKLLVYQIGACKIPIQCGTSLAEQVLHPKLLSQLRDRFCQVEVLLLARGNYGQVRMRSLRAQTLRARGRGQNGRIDEVAVKNLVTREVEIRRAGDKDIALAPFPSSAT